MKKIIITSKQAHFIKENVNSVDSNFSKSFKKEPSRTFKPSGHDEVGKKFNPLSENEESNDKFGKIMIGLLKDIIKQGTEFELPKYFEKYNITKESLLNLLKTNHIINDKLQVYKNNLVDNVKKLYVELYKNHKKQEPHSLAITEDNNDEKHITKPTDPKYKPLTVIHYNKEIAILKDDKNKLFVFYYFDIDKKDFAPYAEIEYTYVGKNFTDGEPEYEYDEDWQVDNSVIIRYVNDNLAELTKGKGLEGFEQGKNLVLIDDVLKAELIRLYDKDKTLVTTLGGITEDTTAASSGSFSGPLSTGSSDVIKRDIVEAEPEATNSNLNNNPNGQKREPLIIKTPIAVDEETTSSSSGQYSQPAIWAKDPNNARFSKKPVYPNGIMVNKKIKVSEQFIYNQISKKLNKSIDEVKKIVSEQKLTLKQLPKLFKLIESGQDLKTQTTWKNGEMVEFDKCTKLNNNTEAENGHCSVGAVDKVVKTKKTKDSLFESIPPTNPEIENLSPQQKEQLNRINQSNQNQILNTLNGHKYTPDSIGKVYKLSQWYDKLTYDDMNKMWYAISDGEFQGNLANKAIDTVNSLSEDDKIYEQVAKKTGKTLEEVKKIINDKLLKSK